MLAEYFAPLPMATGCTSAVCTGRGSVSAAFCCLHAVSPAIRAAASVAIKNFADAGFIASLFPQGFLKRSLRIPEGKQALFVFMFGVGRGGLLLQQVAHQYRGMFELIAYFAKLFIGRVATRLGYVQQRTALLELTESIVDIQHY